MALEGVGQALGQRVGRRLGRGAITLVLVLGAFVALFPVYYTAATAPKTTKGYALSRFAPPREPTLENFRVQFRRFAVVEFVAFGGMAIGQVVSFPDVVREMV